MLTLQVSHTTASSDPSKAETYKVTVRAASYVDREYYRLLPLEGMEQFEKRFGFPIDDETDNMEAVALRNVVYYRAEMLSVIDRERTAEGVVYMCDYRNGAPDAEWQRRELPADWTTLDGFADKLPTAFFDAWLAACRQLNAGILGTIPDRFLPMGATTTSASDN